MRIDRMTAVVSKANAALKQMRDILDEDGEEKEIRIGPDVVWSWREALLGVMFMLCDAEVTEIRIK